MYHYFWQNIHFSGANSTSFSLTPLPPSAATPAYYAHKLAFRARFYDPMAALSDSGSMQSGRGGGGGWYKHCPLCSPRWRMPCSSLEDGSGGGGRSEGGKWVVVRIRIGGRGWVLFDGMGGRGRGTKRREKKTPPKHPPPELEYCVKARM